MKMSVTHIWSKGFIHALLTALYVYAISSFMMTVEDLNLESSLGPTVFLLLFVLSAAVTGFLVFGKPLLWYIDGKKKEALRLLLSTVTCLLILVLALVGIAF